MNIGHEIQTSGRRWMSIAAAMIGFAACAVAPPNSWGAEEARAGLNRPQPDPGLGVRAQDAADLQHQIDTLDARVTDRGLVLTLGDVLFMSGKSDLKIGAAVRLDKLVAFLNRYTNREVLIEGYTDNVGSEGNNQDLSERRAHSVHHYLRLQGIGADRLSASGKGASAPVAGNETASGRQQNRRVEVIVGNPTVATR